MPLRHVGLSFGDRRKFPLGYSLAGRLSVALPCRDAVVVVLLPAVVVLIVVVLVA